LRAVIQRVNRASVTVEGREVGSISFGWAILLGIGSQDDESHATRLADRIVGLRAFSDDQGRMNRSLRDMQGAALVIPNFTLYADTEQGRRPSFIAAMHPERAHELMDVFVQALRDLGVEVQTGEFGAHMVVHLVNDGPVTFVLSTDRPR
jgi:D-aminoacyl-tRNA deacylase